MTKTQVVLPLRWFELLIQARRLLWMWAPTYGRRAFVCFVRKKQEIDDA